MTFIDVNHGIAPFARGTMSSPDRYQPPAKGGRRSVVPRAFEGAGPPLPLLAVFPSQYRQKEEPRNERTCRGSLTVADGLLWGGEDANNFSQT